MTLLFVYGTLKRGGSNHAFLAGQRFVGAAATEPGYRLFDLGSYPGLVEAPDGEAVQGELWEVSPDCLHRLDELEGTAEGVYRRAPARLATPHAALGAETYLYAKEVRGRPACGPSWQG